MALGFHQSTATAVPLLGTHSTNNAVSELYFYTPFICYLVETFE